MIVKSLRILPALLVLLVLFASQAAYAAGAFERPAAASPNGHCGGSAPPAAPSSAPPAEQPCRLPLWLTCCDDHAAVPAGPAPIGASGALVLPLETALVPVIAARDALAAVRVEIPPDTPARLSSVLQL